MKQARDSVSKEVVIRSFKACGIYVEIDGTEDSKIHCLKEGGLAADAATEVTRMTANLATEEMDQGDPFSGLDNDDELEQNETVVDDDD